MPQVIAAGISTNATPPANGRRQPDRNHGRQRGGEAGRAGELHQPRVFSGAAHSASQGRFGIAPRPMRGAPLAVINQTMARQYWPKGDAIGRKFRIPGLKNEPPYQPAAAGSEGWIQIVGVVADARNDGLRNPIKPAVYVPYSLRMRCSRRSWCARACLRFPCCATCARSWCRSTRNSR